MRSGPRKSRSRSPSWAVVEPRVVPDWEAAHVFLEVVRSGSFRAAALKLGPSVNVLRRKIDAFEQQLGVPLLTRHINGVQPTEEGTTIYQAALQMESAAFDLLLARNLSRQEAAGEVRVSVTEGMGTHWLLPQMAEFKRANPNLTIVLQCAQKPADLTRLEADVSIRLDRPKEPDLKVVKLGRIHLMFFAARSYIAIHGRPSQLSDFAKHRFVIMAHDDGKWEEAYREFFGGLSPVGLVSIRNTVSSAHAWSVYAGLGIGALPTYAQAVGASLVPMEFGEVDARDIWLAYRGDAKRVERIRRTIDWIMQCYDPRRFPWFRDEFIHPDRFSELYKGTPLASVFGHAQPEAH